MRKKTHPVRKGVVLAIASACLVLGLATVWTPIPTGVPLLAIGIFLFIGVSSTARRMMHAWRRRSRRVDAALSWVEDRAHRKMAIPLRRTRPLERKRKGVLKPSASTDLTAKG